MWRIWGQCVGTAIACVSCSQHEAVARTAASELGCSEKQVRVTDLEGDRYRAGCGGQSRVYQCDEGHCELEGFYARKAQTRAEREFACDAIEVRWINEETYHVEGCGKSTNYDCDDEGCLAEGAQRDEGPAFVVIPVGTR